jgi:hypothetical protein
MKAVCFSETLVSAYKSARRHIPEEQLSFSIRNASEVKVCYGGTN